MLEKRKMLLYAISSILITICISGFGRMSYGIVMPFMRESLLLSYKQAGMLATATAFGYLIMVLLVGIMAAKWGSKRLVIIGLFLLSVGLVYLFLVESYVASLIGMVLLGIGTAFGYTPLVNIVVGWFPQNRGLMIGVLLCGMGLGTLITSSLIPIFNTILGIDGWRYLWLFYGFITFIIMFIGIKILEDPPVPLHEKQSGDESLLREIYMDKGVMLIAVIYGLVGFAYLIPQSFLFSFMLDTGIDQYQAGFVMGVGGFISILSGPVWGAISDKIGREKSLGIIFFLSSISILIPIVHPSMIGFFFNQFLWGFTVMGMLSLTQALSTEQTDQKYAPIALGYVTIYFSIGQMLGPSLGGIIIDYFGEIATVLWFCLILLILAFLLSTRLRSREKEVRSF